MAQKVTVLGMLIALHSLGLIFASLFTFKWYVDNYKDVGIFGLCEYYKSTNGTFRRMINPMFESRRKRDLNQTNVKYEEKFLGEKLTDASGLMAYTKTYQKCYQLLWPDKEPAIKYLSERPGYYTAMMGVAISSASLGFLTIIWSFLCLIFQSMGSHPRAIELLIVLSILTDVTTITTFGLFMGKDKELYSFKYYGLSFWLSVGASCGFFLSSILFTVNRINVGFKYMLRNYQSQFSES